MDVAPRLHVPSLVRSWYPARVDVRVAGDVDLALDRERGRGRTSLKRNLYTFASIFWCAFGVVAGVRRDPAHRLTFRSFGPHPAQLVTVTNASPICVPLTEIGIPALPSIRGGDRRRERVGDPVEVGRVVEGPDCALQAGFGHGPRLGHHLLVGGDERLGGGQQGERDHEGRENEQRQQGHRQGDPSLISQHAQSQTMMRRTGLLVATGYFSAAPGTPWWRADCRASRAHLVLGPGHQLEPDQLDAARVSSRWCRYWSPRSRPSSRPGSGSGRRRSGAWSWPCPRP